MRAAADEYAEKTREEANAEASETIEEGLRRRARIDDEIKELDARRDAALERMEQLRAELGATMEGHRPAAPPELRQRRQGRRAFGPEGLILRAVGGPRVRCAAQPVLIGSLAGTAPRQKRTLVLTAQNS